jgi:hypothetical protein
LDAFVDSKARISDLKLSSILILQHNDMGEILLSLSYLPTAERLTVVVLKAKELVMTAAGGSCGKLSKL